MYNGKISEFIKRLRHDNNMSQEKLAELIHIDRSAISKWECGRTVPDSSSIMKLSEIFGVSVEEILYGEYKTEDNFKDIEENPLKIYDERNVISKKYNKTFKILLASITILVIIIVSFLCYYFFSSYDAVKVYRIESKSDEVYLTDGILVLTGENIYFRLGHIVGIDESDVSKVDLYYKNEDNKNMIYSSDSSKDKLIVDYYGYNEYFEMKNKDVVFDSLFIDIHYNDEIKTIELNLNEDYSNKRLFFRRHKKIGNGKELEPYIPKDNDLTKIIKESFKYENSVLYQQNMVIDSISYDLYYVKLTNLLMIDWKEEKYKYSIEYFPINKTGTFRKSLDGINYIEECNINEDVSKTTCDNSAIERFNLIISTIMEGCA